jgi:hypothetical protein
MALSDVSFFHDKRQACRIQLIYQETTTTGRLLTLKILKDVRNGTFL